MRHADKRKPLDILPTAATSIIPIRAIYKSKWTRGPRSVIEHSRHIVVKFFFISKGLPNRWIRVYQTADLCQNCYYFKEK